MECQQNVACKMCLSVASLQEVCVLISGMLEYWWLIGIVAGGDGDDCGLATGRIFTVRRTNIEH